MKVYVKKWGEQHNAWVQKLGFDLLSDMYVTLKSRFWRKTLGYDIGCHSI